MRFEIRHMWALVLMQVLAGCASVPTEQTNTVQVEYSTRYFDGSILKRPPAEVQLVRREDVSKAVAGQVGLNILMLALRAGLGGPGSFNKDDMAGQAITDVTDRENLSNPVATEFVQSLQRAVDEHLVQQQGVWTGRSFKKPLVVGGGRANLVYADSADADDPGYQLVLQLQVYKLPERALSWARPVADCNSRSEPAQALHWWAEQDYLQVRQELDQMLQACKAEVLAQLPQLLEK